MWVRGTDLRDSKNEVYRWPPIADGPEFAPDSKTYDGCTTILKKVFGEPDIAHAVWVGQEARRLFALHNAGISAQVFEVYQDEFGQLVRSPKEVPPAELLNDEQYLTKHGFRMSGRAADRGTVVHELLRYWHIEGPLSPADAPYWTDDRISQGDGALPYRCDPDETLGYVLSLVHWLRETGFQPIATEVPGFNDTYGYAATLDTLGLLPGMDGVLHADVKTRAASNRRDALQLVAQSGTEWLGVPGTADTMTWAEMLGDAPMVSASLLVVPEKTTLRICSATFADWVKVMEMYRFMTAPMPFATDKEQTTSEAKPRKTKEKVTA